MHRIVLPVLLAVLLHGAAQAQTSRDSWQRTDVTLGEALDAGFEVVDTYHTGEGHLVFVLQLQSDLLLCTFSEQQVEDCIGLIGE